MKKLIFTKVGKLPENNYKGNPIKEIKDTKEIVIDKYHNYKIYEVKAYSVNGIRTEYVGLELRK